MLHFLQRPLWPLTHNEFFRPDVETPPRHRHGIGVMHRRRARLEDERPQLGEVLTPVVKIEKGVPVKDSLADPIPSPGQSSAKAVSVADMAEYDAFYKRLIGVAPMKNVTSRFAMERMKHTTAYPLHPRSFGAGG
jgi:hypothetical protein